MWKIVLIPMQVQYCGADVGIIAFTYVKASFESGKFTLKILSESGKLFNIGCHLPPK